MRKRSKKILTMVTAATMSLCALSLGACSSNFTPLAGEVTGAVQSNGGFVVEKGDYYYFINGVETYTSDNTYGTPVKGALMRAKKSDVAAKKNTAEVVIPSLMVAGDHASGIYIYGDRVYYATPNNVKNTSGEVENTYLDFKSAALSGADVKNYFNVSDNSTEYRFMEVDGTVYLFYKEDNTLHSYNTSTKTDTILAKDVKAYVVNSTDKTDPYVYYTMGVKVDIDNEGAKDRTYNQVYRVRVDATSSPYNYTYNQEYLDAHDGEVPYTNLGTIVLDGIGSLYKDAPTQFTHDLKDGVTPESYAGYTYTLQSYTNGGIYFTRSDLATTSSTGETGWLYYLSADKLTSTWNSVSGNAIANLDAVAQNTSKASSSALFYRDNGHHYIYVDGANMFRADVKADGSGQADTTLIARGVSGASLLYTDSTSDSVYDYVYYTMSASSGLSVNRAVYNGSDDDYKNLNFDDVKPYNPVKVLDIEHAKDWYNVEIIDGMLFYADAASFGSTSYNYVACVNLNKGSKLMNNVELKDFNDKLNSVVGSEDGNLLHELTHKNKTNLSNAYKYYFYMGQNQLFYRDGGYQTITSYAFDANGYLTYDSSLFSYNIKFAQDEGNKKATFLYSEEDQKEFKDYTEGKGDALSLVDEGGASYRTYSYFVTKLGKMSDKDKESLDNYWKGFLEKYTPAEEEETSLPAWAWALIGVGIGLVVVGAGLAVFLVIRSKRKQANAAPKKPLMYVDTSDNKEIDVYGDPSADAVKEEVEEAPVEEAPAQESAPTEANE